MDLRRELSSVRGILEGDLGQDAIQKENLLIIREQLWQAQIVLQERVAQKDAKMKQLRQLIMENDACLIAQKYIQENIENMKNMDISSIKGMDLVDVDTFLADNPECSVSQENENLFMMERFKDEESRRAKLFSRRMELTCKIKDLKPGVEQLREGTKLKRAKQTLGRLRQNLSSIEKSIDYRPFEELDEAVQGLEDVREGADAKQD